MLTKNLLKTRVRSGKIFPQFIKLDNQDALDLAVIMCDVFSDSIGLSMVEVEEQLEDSVNISSPYFQGFKKLLIDRCEWDSDFDSIEESRWKVLNSAKNLRLNQHYMRLSDFQSSVSDELNIDKNEIFDRLFSDLPEFRKVCNYKSLNGIDLLHRYNSALIQGLLIHSNEITLKVKKANTKTKRMLFRWIKFHQLLVDVWNDDEKDELVLELSGPMSIFKNSQTYGLKLANFFPRVLHLEKWEINAEISFKKKNLKLVIDQKVKINSHYKNHDSYIPVEFDHFIDSFNKNSKDWIAQVGSDFFHIGRQSYCFPDIVFTRKDGQKVHLELFHRWHFHQMGDRLKSVEKVNNNSLILGVCRSSAKKKELDKIINDSKWFTNNGFLFSDFPTSKAVNKVLKQF